MTEEPASSIPPAAGTSLTIVHLSDLHFGPSHRFGEYTSPDGDRVTDGHTLLDSLSTDIPEVLARHGSKRAPVLICVTGDLTDTADLEQFRQAARFVTGLEESLKEYNARTILVPGNHDVQWEEDTPDDRLSNWRTFLRNHLERSAVGSTEHPLVTVQTDLAESHGVLIAAINSASFVHKDKPDAMRGRISADGLEQLESRLDDTALTDAEVRIALVHHHPVLIPDLVEEGRRYDAILDGGDLLRILRRHGFHLVMHGHKHLPFNFSEDSRAAYSTSEPREQRPILIVCGGSIGSTEISSQMQTPTNFYNVLRVKWLPLSGECRTLIEPRQLIRHREGTQLARNQWRWAPLPTDDRYHVRPTTVRDRSGGNAEQGTLTSFGVDDAPRLAEYRRARDVFPVVQIRPSLVPGQAHEARVWCERHSSATSPDPDDVPSSVLWSAGSRHDVFKVKDDPSGRFETVFTYYGPMLVRADVTFPDEVTKTHFVYVRMERDVHLSQSSEASPHA